MMSDIEQCKAKVGGGVEHVDKAEENLKGTHESLGDARRHLANAIGSLGLAFAAFEKASGSLEATDSDLDKAQKLFEGVSSISYAAADSMLARTVVEATAVARDNAKRLGEEIPGFMNLIGDGSLATPGLIGVLDQVVHRRDTIADNVAGFAEAAPDYIRFVAETWQETI